MQIHTPLSLACSVFAVALGIFLFSRDLRSAATRALAALMLGIGWWSFCEFVWNNAPTPALAMRWLHLASPGFLFAGAFYLRFVLGVARENRPPRAVGLLGLYGPPLATMLAVLAGGRLFERVTPASWGWAYWPSPLYYPFLAHILVCFTIGIVLNVRYLRSARTAGERRKGRLMLVATMIPIVSGSLTDGILPSLGIQTYRLGTAAATIMVSLFIYAVLHYRLFLLTPEAVAAEVLGTIPDAVFLVDTEGRLRHMNAAASAMTGRAPGRVEEMRIGDIIELDPRARAVAGGPALLQDLREADATVRAADGRRIPVLLNTSALLDDEGAFAGVVAVAHDLRLMRNLQAQLVQSEKMAAVGQLAAGIAHEINNPMTYLSLNLQKLREQTEALRKMSGARFAPAWEAERGGVAGPPESLAAIRAIEAEQPREERFDEMMEMLEESEEGAARIREIVQNMREFSHRGGAGPEPIDLNGEADKALRLVRKELDRAGCLRRDLGQVPPILGSSSELRQVLVNLLVNAAQAIAPGGAITLRTRAESGCGIVEVEDDGPGVAAEALPYIFDPFYTTKEVGKGTGLGLTISYQLLQRMGGRITVRPNPGGGTTFRVELPLAKS